RFMSADDLVKRAQTQFDAANYGASIGDAKTALDKQSDNAAANMIIARASLRLGNTEDAEAALKRAQAAGADPAVASELRYPILLTQRRFEDALKELAADKSTPQVKRLVFTGQARAALGQEKEAGEAIDQALALGPDDADARLARGRWLQRAGRIDEAKQV